MARILLVDDEALVRTVFAQAIEDAGHRVTLAADGPEAIALFRQQYRDTDLILLDVCMPGLDGLQTLQVLREIDPSVRCCLMCSETAAYPIAKLLASGALDVLSKPISSLNLLVEAVRGLLAENPLASA